MLQLTSHLDGPALLRQGNLHRALQLVFSASGTQTRAGIARETGLTAATASSLVAELIADRLICEVGPAASTGGKRAMTLAVDESHHLLLAVVLRVGEAHAALVTLGGQLAHEERLVYGRDDRETKLRGLMERIGAQFPGRVLAAAVQVPGATDGERVLQSVQLDWVDLPLAERLGEVLGAPTVLVNDVDAEAIAEVIAGGASSGRQLFLHVGTGIGASVTLDGSLAPGPMARVGEIGHVPVVFGSDAQDCRCGRRGCLESAAAMSAMLGPTFAEGMDAAQFEALVAGADPDRLTAGAVALGRVITMLSAMLDPSEVVMGGPITALGETFLDLVRAETSQAPSGTVAVPVRAAAGVAAHAGAAQRALSAMLGVRWNAAQLPGRGVGAATDAGVVS